MSTEFVYPDSFKSRVITDQMNIITDLKRQRDQKKDAIKGYQKSREKVRPKAEFYISMQRKLIPTEGYPSPDPEAFEAWQRFIMMVKLTLDKAVPGLTKD